MWPGLASGLDIVWIGQSIKQARNIWTEVVAPRMKAAGAYTNDTDMIAQLYGMGRFIVCTQEKHSIQQVRGMGAQVGGMILDEVARWDDAESVFKEELAPILLDNTGWTIWTSMPHAGSYFNTMCDTIATGALGDDWALFEGTAEDNPLIDPQGFADLVALYAPGDPRLQEEIYAKRLAGGAGLAFPEWDHRVHRLPERVLIPNHWRWCAGLDWGFSDPCVLTLAACGGEGEVWVMWEYVIREVPPFEVGRRLGELLPMQGALPEWVACDPDIFALKGGPTFGELLQQGCDSVLGPQRVPFTPAPRGKESRHTRKGLTHEMLKWTPDKNGQPQPWAMPKLRIHPRCTYLLRTLPTLRRDEKDIEDVDHLDSHGWDALTYLALARLPHVAKPSERIPKDIHPGWRADGTRRSRDRTPEEEGEELRLLLEQQGVLTGGRYGRRRG